MNNQIDNLKEPHIEQYLEFIQNIISRMSDSAIRAREMCIGLIAAIIVFMLPGETENKYVIALLLVLIILFFSFLDCYYYRQEKLYRKLYENIVGNQEIADVYNLRIPDNIKKSKEHSMKCYYLSSYILLTYGFMLLVVILLLYVFG